MILILWIFHFLMVMFLVRHPMLFIFLNLFDLLECLVMLMTLILIISFWQKTLSDKDIDIILENVFVKHYAPNQMPDPKGEWSLLEYINGNNSELISQSTYLQSSDKDASPKCWNFKGP